MDITPITPASPFVQRLLQANQFRRDLCTQGARSRDGSDDLADSAECLADVANELFWVSTSTEEGRPVKGEICVCSPADAPRSRPFLTGVPLTSMTLANLFTASPYSAIAVHCENGAPVAWGFLDAKPMFTLRLRVTGSGTLVASKDNGVIAVLERGQVYLPEDINRFSWIALVERALGDVRPFPARLALASRFQQVVLAIHNQGHGGALLVVPPNDSALGGDSIAFSHRFSGSGAEVIRGIIDEQRVAQEQLDHARSQAAPIELAQMAHFFESSVRAYGNLLNDTLRNIGELSRLDGAVVMDEDLRVIGFGAKLSVQGGDFQIFSLDALSGAVEMIPVGSLGGTRHQSAARYVHKHHDSMVFVASQDGRLSLFAWIIDDAQVAVLRRLEHFL
jgi:DisA bacterial checkpoint controller nucleotide-binding